VPCPSLTLGEVVRQLRVVFLQPVLVQGFDGLPNGPVQGLASLPQETMVGDILDYGVLEDVCRLRTESLLVDELYGLQLVQHPFEAIAQSGDARQEPHQELSTDDRGQLHGALDLVSETVQARHNEVLDRIRDAHLAETFHETVGTLFTPQDAQIEQDFGHLLDEQRHTLGLLHEGGLEL
jgi:hypothetical protein